MKWTSRWHRWPRPASGVGRNQLLAALLSELAIVLDTFNREGFAAFRDDWMRCSSHENAPVRLSFSHGEPVDGIARGVAENGALQVETADGSLRIFHAGEVSLRSRT